MPKSNPKREASRHRRFDELDGERIENVKEPDKVLLNQQPKIIKSEKNLNVFFISWKSIDRSKEFVKVRIKYSDIAHKNQENEKSRSTGIDLLLGSSLEVKVVVLSPVIERHLATLNYLLIDILAAFWRSSASQMQITGLPIPYERWNQLVTLWKGMFGERINAIVMNRDKDFIKSVNLVLKRTKRNHYVPQVYLKKFSINGLIYEHNKDNGTATQKSVESVGYDSRFYTPLIEITLSMYEDKFPIIREKIINRGWESLDLNEKTVIIDYIIIQYLRVPIFRDKLNDKLIDEGYYDFLPIVGERLKRHAHEIILHRLMLTNNPSPISLVMRESWRDKFVMIILAPDNIHFLSSDNPVLITSKERFDNFIPYLLPGMNVYFPLTSEICLCFHDRGAEILSITEINEKIRQDSLKYFYSCDDIA